MISIMYHYIFNRNTNNLNGIYPMWDDEFRYQLNWLKNNYSIIDPYAFINNIEEEKYFSQKTKKPKIHPTHSLHIYETPDIPLWRLICYQTSSENQDVL